MKAIHPRREFIKRSAAGALCAFFIPRNTWESTGASAPQSTAFDTDSCNIGLQLGTIRDGMDKDVLGSLKKVSVMGYKYLEAGNYADRKFYGYKPAEFKK